MKLKFMTVRVEKGIKNTKIKQIIKIDFLFTKIY